MKRSAFPKPRLRTKSRARSGNLRGNITPTSLRTKRQLKKSLSKSTKPTRSWATRSGGISTISSARTGTSREESTRHEKGVPGPPADIINGVAMAEAFNSSLAAQGLAISSKRSLAVDADVRLSADLADAKRQWNAERMSRSTFWLHSRRHYMDRRGPFRCDDPARTKLKPTR